MPPPPPAHDSLPLFEKSYLSPDADPQLDFNLTPPSPVHESTPLFPNSNLSYDPEEEFNVSFSDSDNTNLEVEQDVEQVEPGPSVSDLPTVTNPSKNESDSGKT